MKKTLPLWRISAPVTTPSEDAVRELMELLFHASPSIYVDAKSGRARASVYLEMHPRRLHRPTQELREGLRRIRRMGLPTGNGRVAVARVRHEDWAESWKRHFHPMLVGDVLLIKPSWSRRKPGPGQLAVQLDPGLSFGTGQHATTRYCLQGLVECHRHRQAASLLDVGTGSGILAIAAARLGYQRVSAFDHDPEAVRMARSNARVNQLPIRINWKRADLLKTKSSDWGAYDVVCANLTDDLLVSKARLLASFLKPNGYLIVAGIPSKRFRQVNLALTKMRLKLIGSHAESGWKSGTFKK